MTAMSTIKATDETANPHMLVSSEQEMLLASASKRMERAQGSFFQYCAIKNDTEEA